MQVKTIQSLIGQIDHGEILLPEFQRGYVWNRDQVRGLMQSLYRGHPTGHLLIWSTHKPSAARGASASNGPSLMLLDGQQRLTTLYVLFKGKAPNFYEGEPLFFDLYFNVQTEEFRFWQKIWMENNPAWISVHDFLKEKLNRLLRRLSSFSEDHKTVIQDNLANLAKLDGIRSYSYTVDTVSGDDFDVDEVVDIFNRVNRAGTSLTRADVALAYVCSIWPEARAEMRGFQAEMAGKGFDIDFNLIIRCLAGVAIGSVLLEGSFLRTTAPTLQAAWAKSQSALRHLVGVLRHDAFIEGLHDLPTPNVLVPVAIYLARHDGKFPTDEIKRRFIRWFYLAGLWARYSGAADSKLQHDVELVAGGDTDPTHELEEAILRERGRVVLESADLDGARIDSGIGLFSHVLARSAKASDWFTGNSMFDPFQVRRERLERHYIFSRRVLRKAGYDSSTDRKLINEVSNRVALAQKADRMLEAETPSEYLPAVDDRQPEALMAQSVPRNRELWHPDRYADFLEARRNLLVKAMNEFIASWVSTDGQAIDESTVRRIMANGENETVEFKSSLRWDLVNHRVNKELQHVVVKTIAAFLNSANGGTLIIGVDDGGTAIGLEPDYDSLSRKDHSNRDKFDRHLHQVVGNAVGVYLLAACLTVTFHEVDGHDVCLVKVEPSAQPVYVEDLVHGRKEAVFYVRAGASTKALAVKEAIKFVAHRF